MAGDSDQITGSHLDALRSLARAYGPGETICIEGEPSRDLLLLLQGSIEVLKGDSVINTVRGRQVFLGQIAFFNSQKRTATLRALTRCDIVRIREEKVEQLLASMPSLSMRLIRDLTSMFVQKEQELTRYQEYGTSANLALQAEGLASVITDFMPALIISMLEDCSTDTRLAVMNAFVDGLPKRCDLSNMTISRKSIPTRIGRDARKELETGLMALIQEKTSGASDRAELGRAGLAMLANVSKDTENLRTLSSELMGSDISFGTENELKNCLNLLDDIDDALEAVHVEQALTSIKQFEKHAEQVARYCRLQRSTEVIRGHASKVVSAAGTIKAQLAKLHTQDREGVKRQDILRNMRFEL